MIHKFEIDGTKIVLDVNSGAVHLMDEIAYDIIDDFPALPKDKILEKFGSQYPVSEIKEVWDEISQLEAEGVLFCGDGFTGNRNNDPSPTVKSLCLNISHDCNLRCRYCFAGSGHFGGDRTLMTAEIGKRAVDFLLENSKERRHCELDFFGGEPLMNKKTVEQVLAYGKEAAARRNKEIKFTLTTNALLLDQETTDFLNRENISVVLSLDGRPAVNDAMRLTVAGAGGSYDHIQPKISSFVESRNNENYFVRGTYTRNNLDFSRDVLHLADLGYKYISVEPVVGSPDDDWSLRERDLPVLFQEYEELVKQYVSRMREGRGFDFFHFNLDLNHGPCLPKRLSGCGAGYEYMAVTPEGDLFPCHQFVGKNKFKLGTVWDGIQNMAMVCEFRDAHIYNKNKCRDCWAKFHCGGGCHANAEFANSTITEPYYVGCELEKKRLECAIYVQVLKAGYKEINGPLTKAADIC